MFLKFAVTLFVSVNRSTIINKTDFFMPWVTSFIFWGSRGFLPSLFSPFRSDNYNICPRSTVHSHHVDKQTWPNDVLRTRWEHVVWALTDCLFTEFRSGRVRVFVKKKPTTWKGLRCFENDMRKGSVISFPCFDQNTRSLLIYYIE